MKKTLFLIGLALLAAGAANAQAFELKALGETLADGQRVDITSSWDELMECFNPEITLTSAAGGSVTASATFVKSECSPELVEDGFEYQYGIGNGKLQMCTFDNCEYVYVGQTVSQTGTVSAGAPRNMLIELAYNIGYDDPGIDNKSVNAEFTLTVEHGGETQTVTFYIDTDTDAASISNIAADADAPVQYFDLQGRPVTAPANGLLIKRQGTKATKVLL